jgi:outer membrane protein
LKKILVFPILCSFLFSNELDIVQKDKKELREIEKKVIQKNYESLKNDWVGNIDLNSNLSKSYNFKDEISSDMNRSTGLSYSQSIFQSGGIEYSIQYAKEQLYSDLISWENENILILETIYETLLNIKKLRFQIEQSDYLLENKEIELVLKKIQYEAGKVDIIELNNAIISQNNQKKENISLKNSLKEKEFELSKYTNLKYNQIKLIDFKIPDKKKFLENSLNIRYENSKVQLLNTSYKQLKSSYLPQVKVSSSVNYQDNENEDNRTNGTVGLSMTMPIFDITKDSKLEKSKLEVLKQKVNLQDLKNQLSYEYEQILTQIDTFESYERTIKENLKLYDDLILVNQSSNNAGMTSDYDLEILQNTKKINEYDLVINDINKKLQYSKLYFKTKANI